MEIKNKIAVVTGGASGIGKEIVIKLLENEIKHVVILDVNEETSNITVCELKQKYGDNKIQFIKTNVTSDKSFEDAFKKVINEFGNIDVVINNAGIVNELDYETMININFTGVVRGTHLGFKYLSKENGYNGGIILNVASYAAYLDLYPLPVYSATKSAIVHLVECLSNPFYEKKSNVKIMALCPGYTHSTFLFDNKGNISEEMQKELMNIVVQEERQKPECVAEASMDVIKDGENGSIWIIDGGKLYKIEKQKLEYLKKNLVKQL